MDWLKTIFPDMTAEQLTAFKQELGKHFIPNDQYNKKVEELKAKEQDTEAAKAQLAENEKLLKELQEKATLTDEYKAKLEKQQADYEDFKLQSEKRLESVTKTTALEKALRQERATEDAIDLLIKDFDLDSLVVKDGAIQDADKLLKSVKEKRPNLFIKETVEGTPPPDGARSDQATGADDTIKRLMGIK